MTARTLLSPLYGIVDAERAVRDGWTVADLARAYFQGGARLLQIRAKEAGGGAFLRMAEAIVEAARDVGAQVIVNDRADIARLARATGVHVGQDDLSPVAVRRVCGPGAMVGLSTHTTDQIEAALEQPISYLAVGPIFPTASKATGYEPVGLEFVRLAASRAGSVPVVAIGGITLQRARSVLDAGAAAVAVISDLMAGDPAERVAAYLRAMRAA